MAYEMYDRSGCSIIGVYIKGSNVDLDTEGHNGLKLTLAHKV